MIAVVPIAAYIMISRQTAAKLLYIGMSMISDHVLNMKKTWMIIVPQLLIFVEKGFI